MDLWRSILVDLEATGAALWPDTGPSLLAALARARPAWHADGACLEHPELDWFAGRAADQAEAVAVCAGCLVRDECLAFAMDNREQGVWGGTTEDERRVMRRDAA